MANQPYSLGPGLARMGANIGQAIQQKGQQQFGTMLQQMQKEQEKTSPQYQLILERLKKMRDDVTAAEKVVKGQEAEAKLAGQYSQYHSDEVSPGYVSPEEYAGFLQLPEQTKAPSATVGKYRKEYMGQPHMKLGMGHPEWLGYVEKLREKELRAPTGKKPSVGEDIKLYDRAKSFLLGSPFDFYEVKDKRGKPTGEVREIPGSGVRGFLAEAELTKGELPIGPFPSGRDPIQNMWKKWDRRKSELSLKTREIVENILVNRFGPRERGELKKGYTPEEKRFLIDADAGDKEAIAELQRRGII